MNLAERGSTLEHFLELLELFTFDSPEIDVAEMQSRLCIGRSTAHRLVKALLKEGMLVKGTSPHAYKLGYSLLSFGHIVASRYEINTDEVSAVLQELVAKTGETGYIGTIHDSEIVYIHKVDSNQPIRLLSYLGKRNPVYCTSSGRSILAYQNQEVVDSVVKKGFHPYTEKTIRTADQLDALLEKVRRQGYDVSADEFHQGVTSIGAPIFDAKRRVKYSVNIVGPNRRIAPDHMPKMIKHVMEASAAIEKIINRRSGGLRKAAEPEPLHARAAAYEKSEPELRSIASAIRILRLFSADRQEWGVREISRRLQMSKTTAHRLITMLHRWGYADKNSKTNRYRLGIKLLTLSGFIVTQEELHREALPVLRELVHEIGETVLIGVWEGDEVNYLHKVECANPIRLRSAVGRRHPVHCTGSGQVMLAYKTGKDIDKFISKGLPRFTNQTITDPIAFKQRLREIRRDGYAVSIDEIYEGTVSIGLPVRDYSDKVVASLTIVGSTATLTADKISYVIEKASRARSLISEKLGCYR